jgi:hypothetical protein
MGMPSTESLILVVIINNLRDLEIARLLGWYRISLKSAPKVLDVDYLAFYQTSAFKDRKWRIEYIAPVRGHELTTRAELFKDEPEHSRANQEYYKIQLGPFVQLPDPIMADEWRRITFFYTTGEYLLNARTVNDLILQLQDRSMIWKALRERSNQSQAYSVDDQGFDVDPDVIAMLLGIPPELS